MTEAQELRVEAAFKRIAGRTGAEAETTANLTKELAAIKERHPREVIAVHESHGEEAWCPRCKKHWPCDAARSARALQAVVEVLDRAVYADFAEVPPNDPRETETDVVLAVRADELRRAIEGAFRAGGAS